MIFLLKVLQKKYDNLFISRSVDKFVCVFMSEDFKDVHLSIIVQNKSTLCSPVTFSAYRNGVSVHLGNILNPNNGLNSYTQFFEAVHAAYNYTLQVDDVVDKILVILQSHHSECHDSKKAMKLRFITRQLHLLTHKGCRTLVQIRPEPTRQNRTEMSEGNRIHAFLPDCALLFRSDRNRRVRSHPNRSRIL